jgi:hypothetical protein
MVLNLLALLMAALVNQLLPSSARLLFASVQFWALTFIVWCAVAVHACGGWILTTIGLLFSIVGIIPVGFACLLYGRNWVGLLEFLFQVVLVAGGFKISRLVGRQDVI